MIYKASSVPPVLINKQFIYMPKPRFNDFSRYKNNELRNYFFRKEMEVHRREKQEIEKEKINDFTAPIFSAIILTSLWGTKEYLSKSNRHIDSEMLYLIVPILAGAVFLLLVVMFRSLITPWFNTIVNKIEDLRVSIGPGIGKRTPTSLVEPNYLDIFNNEVVNRISLALSLYTHTEEAEIDEIQKNFYINEAFQYVKKAVETLSSKIVYTDFVEFIVSEEYSEIRKSRVLDVLNVAQKIISDINDYHWKDKGDDYSKDLKYVNGKIFNIKKKLNEGKYERMYGPDLVVSEPE
jgi:hypothetical protein